MINEQDRARDHLENLLADEAGLTNWEINFIDDTSKWQGDFTQAQIDMIYKIYDKVC
jgi:hypothetical protein